VAADVTLTLKTHASVCMSTIDDTFKRPAVCQCDLYGCCHIFHFQNVDGLDFVEWNRLPTVEGKLSGRKRRSPDQAVGIHSQNRSIAFCDGYDCLVWLFQRRFWLVDDCSIILWFGVPMVVQRHQQTANRRNQRGDPRQNTG